MKKNLLRYLPFAILFTLLIVGVLGTVAYISVQKKSSTDSRSKAAASRSAISFIPSSNNPSLYTLSFTHTDPTARLQRIQGSIVIQPKKEQVLGVTAAQKGDQTVRICFSDVLEKDGSLFWKDECKGDRTKQCSGTPIPLKTVEFARYMSWVETGKPPHMQCQQVPMRQYERSADITTASVSALIAKRLSTLHRATPSAVPSATSKGKTNLLPSDPSGISVFSMTDAVAFDQPKVTIQSASKSAVITFSGDFKTSSATFAHQPLLSVQLPADAENYTAMLENIQVLGTVANAPGTVLDLLSL